MRLGARRFWIAVVISPFHQLLRPDTHFRVIGEIACFHQLLLGLHESTFSIGELCGSRGSRLRTVTRGTGAENYYALRDSKERPVEVRSGERFFAACEAALRDLEADARVPVTDVQTQAAQIDQTMNQEIIFARLCTAFTRSSGSRSVTACRRSTAISASGRSFPQLSAVRRTTTGSRKLVLY